MVPNATLLSRFRIIILSQIASRDLDIFGSSINAVQRLVFKKVELIIQPPQVSGILDMLREVGAAGADLSSFSLTVYAVGDTGMNTIRKVAESYMKEHGGDDNYHSGPNQLG
jgi:beta-RFAP synthase